jgi:CelD/BcsL family acetyltransferase involved in cellulose biosynthesis
MSARIEVIRESAQLEKVRPQWQALFERVTTATPFQSPDWLLPWLRHFRSGQLFAITVWMGSDLAGIAPLLCNDGRLSFVGSGITDYNDVLIAQEHRELVAKLTLNFLISQNVQCELDEIPPTSPLLNEIESVCDASPCPIVDLATFHLPTKRRKQFAASLSRLRQLGECSFECAAAPQIPEYMQALFHLHEERWKTRSETGVLEDHRLREFHSEVAERFCKAGFLRFYGLRFNGSLRSVLYCFSLQRCVYYYLGGFDPDLGAYSPGSLLIDFAIHEARAAGFQKFDFLRGSEPYKYSWGAVDRMNKRLTIYSSRAAD